MSARATGSRQPKTEHATGASLRVRELESGDRVVELLDVDGWKERKRWQP